MKKGIFKILYLLIILFYIYITLGTNYEWTVYPVLGVLIGFIVWKRIK